MEATPRRRPLSATFTMRRLLLLLAAVAILVAEIVPSLAQTLPCTDEFGNERDDGVCPAEEPVDAATCSASLETDVRRKHVLFASIAIKGHALPLLRVASEMAARGYRVSFATHESGKEWAASYGVPFVSAGAFPISADDLRGKLKAMTRDSSNFRGILTMFSDIYVAAARPMFDALLPQLNQSPPDLIVMDIATVGAQQLAHKLQLPLVVNSPSIMFDLGSAPSYIPAWGTGFSIRMSLWNRCMNILFPRLLSVAITPPFMEINKMRWELDLTPFRSQHDLFKGARVILNTAFGLEHPQPLSPMIDAVGPILPIPGGNASKPDHHPLPPSLEKWLAQSLARGAKTSVVYLNLGTMAYIDVWQAQALVEGLVAMRPGEPQVKVLWILPSDQRNIMPVNLPPTVLVKPPGVVSDLDILAHDAVQLVISHCGMVSAQEALVFGRPLLCIPFLVDQPDVAARVVDAGAGFSMDKSRLTAEDVHDAVVELLSNEVYAKAAARVGRLIERGGGINRAIEVIDTTLRVGFQHLETVDLEFPWHKTAMLDVWAVYAAVFCLVAVLIRVQWLLVYFLVSETFGLLGSIIFGSDSAMFDDEGGDEVTNSTDNMGSNSASSSNSSQQAE